MTETEQAVIKLRLRLMRAYLKTTKELGLHADDRQEKADAMALAGAGMVAIKRRVS